MISLTIGCGLALGSSVIVKGVDLQNQFIKEPDFQIRITQEACRTLMETSPDTENMVFFPKEFLENIKQTAGNSLQDETKIQGFYPIIGKQGRDSIKLLNDGETVPTVIQKISSSEKEKLQEFLKEQEITAEWETFAHENGTILLHDLLWSSIFVTLMANKIGGLQFGIYRNCQISSRVFHTAVAALPLTKANRSDFE